MVASVDNFFDQNLWYKQLWNVPLLMAVFVINEQDLIVQNAMGGQAKYVFNHLFFVTLLGRGFFAQYFDQR